MSVHSLDRKLLNGLFFRLLPYQILLIVINAVNGIVDSLYGSNVVGESAMSAIGLFGPMNHFLYAASMMIVSGSQILYGRYLARDRKHINSVLTVNILIALAVSVLTSLAMVIGVVTGGTKMFVSTEPDLTMLNRYMIGQAIGVPALVVGQQLFAFLSLENKTKRTMTASIACLVVNGVLDHIFVVVVPWDTFGLGFSSSISAWVFFVVMAAYYIAGRSEWKFSIKSCIWHDVPDIIRLGYAGALSRFVEMFRCIIVNFLVIKYVGSVGLSAFAASNSFLAVIWAVPFGMMAVGRMLFSVSVGEQDRKSLIDVMKIIFTRGFLLMTGISLVLALCAEPLTMMFYQDKAEPVYQMTVMGFRILPWCMPLSVISLCFAGYVQTAEKKVISVVLPIVDGIVGVVAFSFILIPIMKMNGLYVANVINGLLCIIVIYIAAWISNKKIPLSVEDIMAIPAGFGAGEDDRIDISVRSVDEVVQVSDRITDFCRRKGIDRKHTYYAALFVEEMAGNVVEHGFTKDNKSHSIDIRVIYMNDKLILRIRDNCRRFDPDEYLKTIPDDDLSNVGIKLVYKIAEDVHYQNLLGLNVLTIRMSVL
ncbi:MAG: ATP-binding protein [Clostridiales bacterium]|nr:ATP-binding protein [Clostridiales bacterium]